MTMTLEEARTRVKICNGNIAPKRIGNAWVCDNCGIGLRSSRRTRSGFSHVFDSGKEKACTRCGEVKSISEFYRCSSGLDGRKPHCKNCDKQSTADNYHRLAAEGKTRRLWLPNSLWQAVEQVRGRMTYRDFIIVAVRREVERRIRETYIKKAVTDMEARKPQRR